ncbi:MAG: rhodanese-like domain-containing protein [Verrucomicrobiota bacterium]|nr:rhodanese-like domain-containing protein [Verrucomicrobiota bacterium]
MSNPSSITPKSTMHELLETYPWAQRALFRHYHIGGCSSCAFQEDETVEDLCKRNENIDPNELITKVQQSHDEDQKVLMKSTAVFEALQSNEPCRLVDIRTSEEWEAVKLVEAIHMSQESMQDILAQWPREDLLVIYDHTGKSSLDAATYFQGQGFKNVRCMDGGIDAWAREVDKDVPRYRLEPVEG